MADAEPEDRPGHGPYRTRRRGLAFNHVDPPPFFTRPISAVICLVNILTILIFSPAVSKRVRALFTRGGGAETRG